MEKVQTLSKGSVIPDKGETLSKGSVISAMFLVAGTCIGGGMLILPVTTGINGFVPSLAIMLVCWFAMTCSALLLLEASLWMEEGVHIITMTTRLLGTPGKIVSWLLFLFISYASLVAYTAGGGIYFEAGIKHFFGESLSREWACLLFIIIFGGIIYLGSKTVGRINAILFLGIIFSYVLLIGIGLDEIKPHLLLNHKWSGSLMAIPIFLTSFSFQTMVPSLTPYLKGNASALRLAIIGGTTITLLIYAVWQALILGIIPVEGPHGLAIALSKGEPATQFIHEHVEGKWVTTVAQFFGFFAIVTSFLGIALGLFDFLADGLKIKKVGLGRIFIALLIALPIFYFAVYFERIFIVALDSTGGYGDSILNGIIPVLMVWVGRYKLQYANNLRLPGGKVILFLLLTFFGFTLLLEVMAHTGILTSFYQAYETYELNIPQKEPL